MPSWLLSLALTRGAKHWRPADFSDVAKIDFGYHTVTIDSAGILAEGRWSIGDRRPDVSIIGPSSLSVRIGSRITRDYRIDAVDLRGNESELEIDWSNGATGAVASFDFDAGGLPVGSTLTERVSVSVRDLDDMEVESDKTVLIEVVPLSRLATRLSLHDEYLALENGWA